MFDFINVMRVIGTLLITNSHFDRIWPLAALATGGTLGNVIFFFVAGYCYSPKEKNVVKHFLIKFSRLYIPILIVQLFCIICGIYKFKDAQECLQICLFPTNYWFFPCILSGYCLWFFILKHRMSIFKVFIILLLVSIIVRFMWGGYDTYPFYLAVMGSGIYSRKKEQSCSRIKLTYVFCAVAIFYIVKYISLRYMIIGVLENIIALIAGLLFYLWISQKEVFMKSRISEKIRKITSMIASMSWHIYLVQVPILKKMIVPDTFVGAFFIACLSITVCAVILKFMDLSFSRVIFKRK